MGAEMDVVVESGRDRERGEVIVKSAKGDH